MSGWADGWMELEGGWLAGWMDGYIIPADRWCQVSSQVT